MTWIRLQETVAPRLIWPCFLVGEVGFGGIYGITTCSSLKFPWCFYRLLDLASTTGVHIFPSSSRSNNSRPSNSLPFFSDNSPCEGTNYSGHTPLFFKAVFPGMAFGHWGNRTSPNSEKHDARSGANWWENILQIVWGNSPSHWVLGYPGYLWYLVNLSKWFTPYQLVGHVQ